MTSENPDQCFVDYSISSFGESLSKYGYWYEGTYIRPRGTAIEFAAKDRNLFVACEGRAEDGALHVDLIVFEQGEAKWRISLNQALWYAGVRSIIKFKSCADQLDVVTSNIDIYEDYLVSGNPIRMDERYCFPMSDIEGYFKSQRGK